MPPAVLIEKLQKRYGAVEAVKEVSIQVEPGEIFGLLGPNGAGKTTTLRCLCTLATPDAGKIEVSGISVLDHPKLARQRLGYVAQEVALDKVLTGRELLQLQAALYHLPRSTAQEQIAQSIALLGLQDWADLKTGTYSGGLKKRLDLAAGLLHQPDVLVLDEPTVGLDIETRLVVWEFLRQLREAGEVDILIAVVVGTQRRERHRQKAVAGGSDDRRMETIVGGLGLQQLRLFGAGLRPVGNDG
ncbi:MAG: ABC transporter ATP-binding protein, partial [Leptolyngbyaceae cyanobacterium CSU_1_4]|nr:ABC transporter ATP-binding protein [Leptolyngbyaceae cyanobacterium CSU_1_4]